MEKYLFRCSIDFHWSYPHKDKSPVYIVATDKEEARSMVQERLKYDCKVKIVTKLGRQISGIMFRGK